MNILIFLIVLFVILFLGYLRVRNDSGTTEKLPSIDTMTVLEVSISKINTELKDIKSAALSAENMFVSLHGLLNQDSSLQDKLSFEMVFSGKTGIKFYVTCPTSIVRFVESQIFAHHPNAQVRVAQDYTGGISSDRGAMQMYELSLSKPYFFPIKIWRDFETDPLSSFTSALSTLHEDEEFWFQTVLKPIPDTWQKLGFEYVKAIKDGQGWGGPSFFETFNKNLAKETVGLIGGVLTGLFVHREAEQVKPQVKPPVKLSSAQEDEIKTIENKLSRVGYSVNMRVLSYAPDPVLCTNNFRSFVAGLKQYTGISTNAFSFKEITPNIEVYKARYFDERSNMTLNSEELSTIYHFPAAHIETPNIAWDYSKMSEPPANLPTENCVYMGDTMFRNNKVRFGLQNTTDRLRHMYLVGKSGVGKSTLFQTMMIQDIKNGAGICMLDPHGETIDKVLEYIPQERMKDVIYIDPSDEERPVGLNLLELDKPEERNLMASGLLSAIKHHFDYSWGPRLEYLLNYALLTLVQIPGTTMLSIVRLLTDKNYRNYIVHQIDDPVLKKFWDVEYKEYLTNQKFISEAISPIQNKVNRFLASTTMRNLLGQAKSTIDIWDIMQNRKILLINLSKGKIGQDNANLLGALLVSRIQFYALQRAKVPESERTPFYLYVDEFQNFATGSFSEILSESRKYGLGLYLTNQYTAQLSEDILHAVLGNVGTIATFAAGSEDARIMSNEFSPITAENINTLQRFYIYIKLMIDGMTSLPFSARILLPWEEKDFLPPQTNNKERVIQMSRETYGTPREYVETKIAKWLDMNFDKGLAISETYRKSGGTQK